MSCTATPDTGELDFVLALHTRSKAEGECRGPLLRLTFQRIFDSRSASDLLWSGFQHEIQYGDYWRGSQFDLCGAHWLDLACLIWMRARQQDSAEFHLEADQLLRDTCKAAGWDAKEIVNMFQWQRARLT